MNHSRHLPQPIPDPPPRSGQKEIVEDPLDVETRRLRALAKLRKKTGKVNIKVDFNQGGVTAAKAYSEEPIEN